MGALSVSSEFFRSQCDAIIAAQAVTEGKFATECLNGSASWRMIRLNGEIGRRTVGTAYEGHHRRQTARPDGCNQEMSHSRQGMDTVFR
jgi:hypothetical protein